MNDQPTPEPTHYCDPGLHDGKRTPATWLVRQAIEIDPAKADSLAAALMPSAGTSTMFATCDDHLLHALQQFGTRKFIVRSVTRSGS